MKILFKDGTEKEFDRANSFIDSEIFDGWTSIIKRGSLDEDDDKYEDIELIATFNDDDLRGIIL